MSDESKKIEIQNYFEQTPYGWRAIATPIQKGGYAPYCFQVTKDTDSIAIIFIQRIFWDEGSVFDKFHEYDVINYIKQNFGQRIKITTKGLQQESD